MAEINRKKVDTSLLPLQAFLLLSLVMVVFGVSFMMWGVILYPFIISALLAYLMMPLMDRVSEILHSRPLGALMVISLFAGLLFIGTIGVWPILKTQAFLLIMKLPGYFQSAYGQFLGFIDQIREFIPDSFAQELQGGGAFKTAKWAGIALKNLLSSGNVVLNTFSFLVVVPLLLFFFLKDGKESVRIFLSIIPPRLAPFVHKQLREMDGAVSGFMRGQAFTSLILGIFYAVSLSILGLDFAIIIGLGTGLMTFLPYIGAFIGFAVAFLVGFQQFDALGSLLWIPGIFAIAQCLDAAFLTPYFVGRRVQLHPVWMLLALFLGGSAYGITGAFFGVPVAAMIGVLVRFGTKAYREHPSFKG